MSTAIVCPPQQPGLNCPQAGYPTLVCEGGEWQCTNGTLFTNPFVPTTGLLNSQGFINLPGCQATGTPGTPANVPWYCSGQSDITLLVIAGAGAGLYGVFTGNAVLALLGLGVAGILVAGAISGLS
jgi:hypothetical protein